MSPFYFLQVISKSVMGWAPSWIPELNNKSYLFVNSALFLNLSIKAGKLIWSAYL